MDRTSVTRKHPNDSPQTYTQQANYSGTPNSCFITEIQNFYLPPRSAMISIWSLLGIVITAPDRCEPWEASESPIRCWMVPFLKVHVH